MRKSVVQVGTALLVAGLLGGSGLPASAQGTGAKPTAKESPKARGKAPVGSAKEMEAAMSKLEKRVASLERKVREMERNKPERPGAGMKMGGMTKR